MVKDRVGKEEILTKKEFWAKYGSNANVAEMWARHKRKAEEEARAAAEEEAKKKRADQIMHEAHAKARAEFLAELEAQELENAYKRQMILAEREREAKAREAEEQKREIEARRILTSRRRKAVVAELCLCFVILMGIGGVAARPVEQAMDEKIEAELAYLNANTVVEGGYGASFRFDRKAGVRLDIFAAPGRMNDAKAEAALAPYMPGGLPLKLKKEIIAGAAPANYDGPMLAGPDAKSEVSDDARVFLLPPNYESHVERIAKMGKIAGAAGAVANVVSSLGGLLSGRPHGR
jgi:hypothetical protein